MKKNYIYPKVESAPVATTMHLCNGSVVGSNINVSSGTDGPVSGGNEGSVPIDNDL